MHDRRWNVVVASTLKGGMGLEGKLPWRIPADLHYFSTLTSTVRRTNDDSVDVSAGRRNAVVMGRKTWESLPSKVRPLPGRLNVVLSASTREDYTTSADVLFLPSLPEFINLLKTDLSSEVADIFIIGGAKLLEHVYAHHLHLISYVYWTRIGLQMDCDVSLSPVIPEDDTTFKPLSISPTQQYDGIPYDFVVYGRLPSPPEKENRKDFSLYPFEAMRESQNKENHRKEEGRMPCCPSVTIREHEEFQYLDLVKDIIVNGVYGGNRTGVGAFAKFGAQMRFNLRESFPLFTTKRVFWRGVLEELLFFIRGDTNANHLTDIGVKIWEKNGTREYLDGLGLQHREVGDLGPVYGFQWRHFGASYEDMHTDYSGKGFDQLKRCIDLIKENPQDRRMLMSAWNPPDLDKMALPPCHMFCQFHVENGELSCLMYQRSCDMGLGVPFNVASYSLLTLMVAKVCGLKPGEFVHCLGNVHVYENHVKALHVQLQRVPRPFPLVRINRDVESIEDFKFGDFDLVGYQPYPKIEMDMAV